MRLSNVLLVLLASLGFASCGSAKKAPYKITLSDVDSAVEHMMTKFGASAFLDNVKETGGEPGIAVDRIVLESDQRVNTDRILQTIENRVVNMGAFEVVSQENLGRFKDVLADQNMDWFDQHTVPDAGNLFGFRYVIGGKLFGDTERQNRSSTTEYRLLLKVFDIERGTIKWSETYDLTKNR